MIYIVSDHKGEIVAIFNSKSEDLVKVYLQAKCIGYDKIESMDKKYISLDQHLTGIFPIIETTEKIINMGYVGKTIRFVK